MSALGARLSIFTYDPNINFVNMMRFPFFMMFAHPLDTVRLPPIDLKVFKSVVSTSPVGSFLWVPGGSFFGSLKSRPERSTSVFCVSVT